MIKLGELFGTMSHADSDVEFPRQNLFQHVSGLNLRLSSVLWFPANRFRLRYLTLTFLPPLSASVKAFALPTAVCPERDGLRQSAPKRGVCQALNSGGSGGSEHSARWSLPDRVLIDHERRHTETRIETFKARVEAAARCNPDWRRRYFHLAMRRHRSIAKVAMGRRLAVRLYWMWRNGCEYSPSLEFGSYAGQLGTGHGVK